MMRWSFWLFVLAEFCRRCETKGTWRGVCSGVQGQSSWGGSRGAPWSCRLFSPGVKLVSLAFWKCYKMCHRTSVFACTTLRGGGHPNIFSSVLCKSREWPRRTVGAGVQTPPTHPWPRHWLNVVYGRKEKSMLTNCLAACAHLTITVCEIERDIGQKSSFFHTPCIRSVGLAPTRLVWKN